MVVQVVEVTSSQYCTAGTNGSDSSISGSGLTTITSAGGGNGAGTNGYSVPLIMEVQEVEVLLMVEEVLVLQETLQAHHQVKEIMVDQVMQLIMVLVVEVVQVQLVKMVHLVQLEMVELVQLVQ
jgi:hypothetical protein